MEKADFAFMVSFVGMCISAGTLYEANNQRVIAEKAYNNALTQTRIQTRAYIVTNGAQLIKSAVGQKDTVRVQLKNAGSTPAQNVRVFSHLYYVSPQETTQVLGAPNPIVASPLLPGGEGGWVYLQKSPPASAEDIESLKSGQAVLRAVIRIIYDTAYSKDEVYDSCLQTNNMTPELSTTSLTTCQQ